MPCWPVLFPSVLGRASCFQNRAVPVLARWARPKLPGLLKTVTNRVFIAGYADNHIITILIRFRSGPGCNRRPIGHMPLLSRVCCCDSSGSCVCSLCCLIVSSPGPTHDPSSPISVTQAFLFRPASLLAQFPSPPWTREAANQHPNRLFPTDNTLGCGSCSALAAGAGPARRPAKF